MDWTAIEVASAIVGACVPTYGPIFARSRKTPRINVRCGFLLKGFWSSKKAKTSSSPHAGTELPATRRKRSQWYSVDDNATDQHHLARPEAVTKTSEQISSEDLRNMHEIHVEGTVEVV